MADGWLTDPGLPPVGVGETTGAGVAEWVAVADRVAVAVCVAVAECVALTVDEPDFVAEAEAEALGFAIPRSCWTTDWAWAWRFAGSGR
jgi:hypothetical protein